MVWRISNNSLGSDIPHRHRLFHFHGPHVRAFKERMMMKHLLLLALGWAAVPAQARDNPDDPIAWSCFYCTEEERQAFALRKGEGGHLVYTGFNYNLLYAYQVERLGNELVVQKRYPAYWLTEQFNELILKFNKITGEFVYNWSSLSMIPPDWPATGTDATMWGHHVSSLHPMHLEARATAQRVLNNTAIFSHFRAGPDGRVIVFDFQLNGSTPFIARLGTGRTGYGSMDFYFDHKTRNWEYLESKDYHNPIQESAEDFLAADGGPRSFNYRTYYDGQPHFMQRAKWAGVQVHGELNGRRPMRFDCSRMDGNIQCFIIHL